MKVWIFVDSTNHCGKDAVKGIYETETHYLELFEMGVK